MQQPGDDGADAGRRWDLVLAGGTLVDPVSGPQRRCGVAIADGKVAAIGDDLGRSAREVVDCRGAFVTPGLIDVHTHLFNGCTTLGAPVDEACLRRGVTAAADAGSAGCWTFAGFERFVVRTAPIPVFAFLNVSAIGIPDMRAGELKQPDYLHVDGAVETARRYPGIIKGFKARLGEHQTGGSCLPALQKARAIGDAARLPLLLHVGGSEEPLPEILSYLRPGDIVSHCYTGLRHGILDGDELLPAVRDARAAGILFDSAHGASNLSYAVARRAIAGDFLPDTISSDNSLRNWRGPVFDLATTMSKFLALGVSLDAIVARVTGRPAQILGIAAQGHGQITVGMAANLTVLRLTDRLYDLRDATGETLAAPRLEPELAIVAGQVTRCAPWRGAEDTAEG